MASHPFKTHHAAAGKAFAAGNHAQAMHHIGHLMVAVRNAAKGQTTGPTPSQAMAAANQGDTDDLGQPESPLGISTPAPTPAKPGFFGQFNKVAPKAPPKPMGGFNKGRFAGMRGR